MRARLSTAGVRVGLWPFPVSDGLPCVSRAVGLPHVSHGGLRRVCPDRPAARSRVQIFRPRGASQCTVPRLTCVSRSPAACPWVTCILQSLRGCAKRRLYFRLAPTTTPSEAQRRVVRCECFITRYSRRLRPKTRTHQYFLFYLIMHGM